MKKKIFCVIAIVLALFTCLLPLAVNAESDFNLLFLYNDEELTSDFLHFYYTQLGIFTPEFIIAYFNFEEVLEENLVIGYYNYEVSLYLSFLLVERTSFYSVPDLSFYTMDYISGEMIILERGADYSIEPVSEIPFQYTGISGDFNISDEEVNDLITSCTYKVTFSGVTNVNLVAEGAAGGSGDSMWIGDHLIDARIYESSIAGSLYNLMTFVGSPIVGTGMLGMWQVVLKFITDRRNEILLISTLSVVFIAGVGGIRKAVTGS